VHVIIILLLWSLLGGQDVEAVWHYTEVCRRQFY
jgi:hypothetical protein